MNSKLPLRSYFIATFLFVFFSFKVFSQTAVPPAAGNGSSTNPFQISTVENLYWISQNSQYWTRYFIQTNDINAAETEFWDGGKGFTPIGTEPNRFYGSYDGAGYVIDSLYINRPDSDCVGLFGYNSNIVGSNHYVESLGITNAAITGKNYVGVLAGIVYGRVRNCYSTGVITSSENNSSHIGGLVGRFIVGTMEMSYSLTNIQVNGSFVGGLVGTNSGLIRDSYAKGSVSGNMQIGGLVGLNFRSIDNCYSVGAVTGNGGVGGLIGANTDNAYNNEVDGVYDIETSGISESAAGEGKTTAEMHDILTYLRGDWDFLNENINGTDDIWGINDTVNNGYPFFASPGDESKELPECYPPLKPISKIKFASIKAGQIEIFGVDAPYYSAGEGYAIFINSTNDFSTPSDGDAFYANPEFNNWGEQCIYFGDDSNPQVIISNLASGKYYFKLYAYNYCGNNRLYETEGEVDSMVVAPAYIVPKGDGSVDKPYAIQNLENLTWLMISDSVWNKNFIQTAHIDAGSFNGWPDDISFSSIGSEKTPFSGKYNGQGFEIQNLYMNLPDSTGVGLFGHIDNGAIYNLGVTNVDILGKELVGALVGYLVDGLIRNCYSTGECNARSDDIKSYVGGLVGYNEGTIFQSYSKVITYTPQKVSGGLVGFNGGEIENCFATGQVEAVSQVGGLIGYDMGNVRNCYATGKVIGSYNDGGFVGIAGSESNIQNCFWDTETSGISTSMAGTGKTTAEMKDPVLFMKAGWDFVGESINGTNNYWDVKSCVNEGYPYLREIGEKEAPQIISSHPDEHYDGSGHCELNLKDYRGLVKATDNCTPTEDIIIYQHPAPGTIVRNQQIVTLSAYDYNKNLAQVHFMVTLEDVSAPVPDENILPLVESECMVNDLDAPTATDMCEGQILGVPDASLPILDQGTTTITWRFEDEKGNFVTQTQDVIISDETAPVADEASLSNITAVCEVASLSMPTATDNCAGQITGTHDAELPITAQGTTVVTWAYDDGNGNVTTQTQNVIIDDVTVPVADIATLTDITAECGVSTLTAPTATDNCTGQITGTHDAALPITAQGTTVITWTYDDGNGNVTTQTQNVIIDDVTVPVADIATLTDITAECGVSTLTAPTATDNCAGQITGTHDAELPITAQGTTVITWTYDDGNGNVTTQTQNVIIDDVTAPVANTATLTDFTAECEVSTLTAPTATDNCTGQITGTHDAALPITAQGTTVITWTYDDGNGNVTTQTQNVIIDDVTAPVANTATLTDFTAECEVSTLTAPTATDNCTGQITGTHDLELPIAAQGTTVITWTYDDGNGNVTTQTQNVIIDDVTVPVADIATLTDITAECEVSELTAPMATDNCTGQITGTHDAELPITAQGTTVVTWTYNDGNGNVTTQTQNVIIDDVTVPVADIATLTDITAECGVSTLTAPTATDNCTGQITGTHDAELPITAQGTTVVTWAYDDGNGNVTTQTQNVIIDDVTVPVADIATLTDITAECEVSTLTAPTATDNCTGQITGTHDAELPITAQETTVVTWTYDDGNGNTSTQTQNVVISDETAPVANVATLSDITAECEVSELTVPTATDNCAGQITGTHDAELPITAQETTVVTWTYDDGNGNTSTQTQNVVISDETAPVANVATLSDITAECEVSELTVPTATDNCAGQITGTHDAELPITAQETTVVTWTYDDGNGNTSTQTQNVVISDETAPVANVATLSDITAECEVSTLTAPTATDNCTGQITGTQDVELPITAQGTTIITWTYDDGNGNTSTQTQNVVISDETAPVANVATLTDITAECEVSELTAPTASDNCAGQIEGVNYAELPITAQGTTVINWIYDDGNGNVTTQSQNIIIADDIAPVADVANLPDITAECEVTSLMPPTATDNCAGQIEGVNYAELPITAQGTTVINWIYDDGNGNVTTQSQNIIIADDIAPVADVANLPDITAECEVTSLMPPTATDNCSGQIEGIHYTELPITSQGSIVITWIYNDDNGNTSTQTQNVIIDDVTAPTIMCAGNETIDLVEGETEFVPSGTAIDATAGDNCNLASIENDVNNTISLDGEIFAPGEHTIIWTATDDAGNSETCEFVLTVNEFNGVRSEASQKILVYPNPSKGRFIIENAEAYEIIVTDVSGKRIFMENVATSQFEVDLAEGIYFIHFKADLSTFTKKVIIRK